MSPGSINSFNASLSASSYQWLKHQIKEIQGNSSCNSLISPESLPLFTEAPSEERRTILLKTDSRECFLNQGHPDYQLVQRLQKTSWLV